MTDSTPGWQADPMGRHEYRYWDGSRWTDDVSDSGVASTDAYDAAGAAATDPTTAGPAPGDATTEWPAAPSPPTASTPTSPVGEPSSGGSKKGLLIGGGVLAVVALAVAAFLLLGGDDDDDNSALEASIASQLRADGGLTDEQAECMAGYLVEEIGADRLEDVDFTADEPPPELEDEFNEASDGVAAACGMPTDGEDDPVVDDGSEDASDLGDVDFDAGSQEMLADIYEESLGLDREKAECLAGRIAEAISSGSLTEEQAMSDMFNYLEDCDISLEEIGAN